MPIHAFHLGPWDVRTWLLFGKLPFAILILVLYLAGRGRGWPWRSNLLATAALAAGLSLGARLLPSVLGAVGGGIALWLLAQRVLGLRRPPLATLALGLTAVVAVGRWGCLLNGCCFGRTTDLPWGIQYGAGSATWILHRALGWIAADSGTSLAVHPYPLYESVGLLLWLAVALGLRRRLRSEAALLLLTAAFDLGLRGAIDGTRAMVNVWWALLGSGLGLDLFQWSLFCAALAAAAAAVAVEMRARRRSVAGPVTASEPGTLVSWLVFVGLWTVGWLSDTGQTPFLHRVLIVALIGAALALRWPARVRLSRWGHACLAPASAVVLVLPLAVHLERIAQASDGQSPSPSHGWIYDVDHRRGAIVRVGAQQESPAALDERRAALDLPVAAPPTPVVELPPSRTSHTWVGAGAFGGGTHYRVGDSCNDQYQLYDRRAGGGWAQVEREVLGEGPTVVWWGGRAGTAFESQDKTDHDEAGTVFSSASLRSYTGQVWVTLERLNFAIGVGGIACLRQRRSTLDGASLDTVLRPSFRLRLGWSLAGLDGGFNDRESPAGLNAGHIGLSGTIGRGFTLIRHPDDALIRYFAGALIFPGADPGQTRLMLGGSLEAYLTPRFVVGVQGGGRGGEGGFGVAYVRAVVGP
jgi:hypothetical protein